MRPDEELLPDCPDDALFIEASVCVVGFMDRTGKFGYAIRTGGTDPRISSLVGLCYMAANDILNTPGEPRR